MDLPQETSWCERSLRDAILAGDKEAWRAWYAAYFDRLAAYARWRCGGLVDMADEVTQETWLLAVRKLREFDPKRGTFWSWLCGIAANAARNRMRSHQRERRRFQPLLPSTDPSAGCCDGVDSAAREKCERVASALAQLPDHYEAVLRAKYLDQQSVAEIALARGDSLKAIESLLTRARQAFREAYEKPHE